MIINITAESPRFPPILRIYPENENKHLTSSQQPAFTDQTSCEPSQTAGSSKMITTYFEMTFWVDLHCERVWFCLTWKCNPIPQVPITIHKTGIQKVPDGGTNNMKERVFGTKT